LSVPNATLESLRTDLNDDVQLPTIQRALAVEPHLEVARCQRTDHRLLWTSHSERHDLTHEIAKPTKLVLIDPWFVCDVNEGHPDSMTPMDSTVVHGSEGRRSRERRHARDRATLRSRRIEVQALRPTPPTRVPSAQITLREGV
jgi:hypothetical protein